MPRDYTRMHAQSLSQQTSPLEQDIHTDEHPIEPQVSQQRSQSGTGMLTWWAACSFAAILGFSRLSYGLLLPALRINLGGSYSAYGLLGTVNFVGYLLGTLATPFLLTRIQRHLALNLVASLAMNATLLLSAFSVTVWQLGIWRLLSGLFSAVATVLTLALTLECVAPHKRGKTSGFIWMGAAAGILFSGLIAPPILTTGASFGWRLIWIVMSIAGGIAALGFAQSRRNTSPYPTQHPSEQQQEREASPRRPFGGVVRPLFQPGRLLFLTLVYFCFGCGYIIYLTFFVALLEQQGVPVLDAGFVWAAIGLAGVLSSSMWGRVIDRWPTGFALALPLFLGVAGSFTVLLGKGGWEYAGAALLGLSTFIGPPLMVTVLLKRAVADEHYATSFSMLTACFATGQIIGPLVGGLVIEQVGLTLGTASSGVILAAAALCACGYGLMQRRAARSSPSPAPV